jgi:hypothetical protein
MRAAVSGHAWMGTRDKAITESAEIEGWPITISEICENRKISIRPNLIVFGRSPLVINNRRP